MAPGKDAVEFNKIIQANRDKKKKQDLADKIFNRRSSAPPIAGGGAIGGRKGPAGPSSLSARAGIAKPGKPSKPANPLFKAQNSHASLKRAVSTPQLNTNKRRTQALDALVSGRPVRAQNVGDQVNIRSGGGFSIKGSATQKREYTVVAQNFAPGTTAEDIGSVFAPDAEAVGLLSCRLLVSTPTVIAELVFDNQDTAEHIVKSYNNKKADNRVLYVYHSDATSAPSQPRDKTRTAPKPAGLASRITGASVPITSSDDLMDVEDTRPRYQQPYTPPRGPRVQPEVQDGRYGFGDNASRPRREPRNEGGLVSDTIIAKQGRRNDSGGRQFRR